MKGVILAGGLGTRLRPLTKVTNKHLLPVYDKPMIYYPLETLCKAGIKDIMIVTGGNSAGDFLRLLGNGREFGLKDIYYTYQEGEGGIADALKLCEHFAEGQRIVVILGDNIVEDDITPYVRRFEEQDSGARILPKEPVCGDGDLHVRSPRLRLLPAPQALGARRARDHRREQRLYQRRRLVLRHPRRLVDRRRDVRELAPRRQPRRRSAARPDRSLRRIYR